MLHTSVLLDIMLDTAATDKLGIPVRRFRLVYRRPSCKGPDVLKYCITRFNNVLGKIAW